MLQDWAKLLQALASLAWPIFSFAVILIYRRDIGILITRLRRGKVLGQEFELEKSLDELDESANLASVETPRAILTSDATDIQLSREREFAKELDVLMEEASRSPKVALMILWSDMERELRQLLASMGLSAGVPRLPFYEMMGILNKRGGLPASVKGSIRNFLNIRNRIVHGGEASQDDILRAIDSGLTILQTIRSIPHEINIVYHPGVEVFSDPNGETLREGIKAVLLKTTSPDKSVESLRVFPTTCTHFKKGIQVSWEWNRDIVVGESWYRNPDSGNIEKGWHSSMEFIGRSIEDL